MDPASDLVTPTVDDIHVNIENKDTPRASMENIAKLPTTSARDSITMSTQNTNPATASKPSENIYEGATPGPSQSTIPCFNSEKNVELPATDAGLTMSTEGTAEPHRIFESNKNDAEISSPALVDAGPNENTERNTSSGTVFRKIGNSETYTAVSVHKAPKGLRITFEGTNLDARSSPTDSIAVKPTGDTERNNITYQPFLFYNAASNCRYPTIANAIANQSDNAANNADPSQRQFIFYHTCSDGDKLYEIPISIDDVINNTEQNQAADLFNNPNASAGQSTSDVNSNGMVENDDNSFGSVIDEPQLKDSNESDIPINVGENGDDDIVEDSDDDHSNNDDQSSNTVMYKGLDSYEESDDEPDNVNVVIRNVDNDDDAGELAFDFGNDNIGFEDFDIEDDNIDMLRVSQLFTIDYTVVMEADSYESDDSDDEDGDDIVVHPPFVIRKEEDVKTFLFYLIEMFNLTELDLMFSVDLYSILLYSIIRVKKDKVYALRMIKAFVTNNVNEVFRLVDFHDVWNVQPGFYSSMDVEVEEQSSDSSSYSDEYE